MDITEGRGPTSRPRGLAILVHGTRISARLARKDAADAEGAAKGSKPILSHPRWFDDGSLFRTRAIDPADFETVPFAWTGRNSAVARDKAARALGAMLDQKASEQYDLIVLIGHSHGGNVILKSLDYMSEDKRRIAQIGLITLGTTFIDVNPAKKSYSSLLWWSTMCFIPLFLYFISIDYIRDEYGSFSIGYFSSACILTTFACLIIPLIDFAQSRSQFYFNDPHQRTSVKPEHVRAKAYLKDRTPLYIVRSAYDEATAILLLNNITSQLLNLVINVALGPVGLLINRLSLKKNKILLGLVRLILFFIFLITIPIVIKIVFRTNHTWLFISLFHYISISMMVFSPLRLLNFWSFAILGLPEVDFTDHEIHVDSVPDLNSQASVFTVTRSNPVFLALGRHFLHTDKTCVEKVRQWLLELSSSLHPPHAVEPAVQPIQVSTKG